jgi:hypothetical protein
MSYFEQCPQCRGVGYLVSHTFDGDPPTTYWCDQCLGHQTVLGDEGVGLARFIELVMSGRVSSSGWQKSPTDAPH